MGMAQSTVTYIYKNSCSGSEMELGHQITRKLMVGIG